ncbi:MAG: sulfatase, partial [Limisphaerales bacterium]
VGRLLDGIDQLGLRENTLIFFTSDNGTTPKNFIRHEGRSLIKEPTVTSTILGQRLEGQKGQFNDWGTRVPTLVRWPGKVTPGSTDDLLADIADLLPTFAALAGRPQLPHGVDGHSFATLFTEGRASSRPWIAPQTRSKISIRTRDWKLLNDGQLFDMRGDPFHEVAIPASRDTPETAAARKKLTALLAGFPAP